MDVFGVGLMELLVIIVIAFLVLGPHELREIGRGLGKAVREFKKYGSALTRDYEDEFEKGLESPSDQQSRSTKDPEEKLSESNATSRRTEAIQPRNADE